MFRAIVVIPVYNHDRYLPTLVKELVGTDLAILLVDDGSSIECARVIDKIVAAHSIRVGLLRLGTNQGKGAAVLAGIRRAREDGYTHALQVDADGQHAIQDAPALLEIARRNPEALVTGQPIFDESVPKVRRYLRYLTHFMVSVNTLNSRLVDAMCGFRVYPVKETLALDERVRFGQRMDFDIEVLVRLDWAGVPILTRLTAVRYPMDGVSHFRMVRDNARITSLHTRLFFGMLWRAPRLLLRKRSTAR